MYLDTFYGVVVRKDQEDRKMSRIWVGISVCVCMIGVRLGLLGYRLGFFSISKIGKVQ